MSKRYHELSQLSDYQINYDTISTLKIFYPKTNEILSRICKNGIVDRAKEKNEYSNLVGYCFYLDIFFLQVVFLVIKR